MQFSEIIGQQKAKNALFKAVDENRLPHALILKGAEGIGKLAFANAIAQYVNCENPSPDDSCGKCGNCVKIRKGIHPDVKFILPVIKKKEGGKVLGSDDYYGAFRSKFFQDPYFSMRDWLHQLEAENKQMSIFINDIREMRRKLVLKAFEAEYKVVIIWNAEKIRPEAANALLKTLEEPPEKTIIILTVSDPTQLLSTINSRCQRLQLHRIDDASIQDWLVKSRGLSREHSVQISQLADGSVAKAIELINQTDKEVSELYKRWLRVSFTGDYPEILKVVETLSKENREYQKVFLTYAIQKMRDSLLFSFNMEQLAMVTEEEKEFHRNFSKFMSRNGAEEMVKLLEDSFYHISRNANTQMVMVVLSLKIHSLLTGNVLI